MGDGDSEIATPCSIHRQIPRDFAGSRKARDQTTPPDSGTRTIVPAIERGQGSSLWRNGRREIRPMLPEDFRCGGIGNSPGRCDVDGRVGRSLSILRTFAWH